MNCFAVLGIINKMMIFYDFENVFNNEKLGGGGGDVMEKKRKLKIEDS